jgi:hypothetical protein
MSGERHPSRKSNSLSIVDDANAKNLHRPLRFGSKADIASGPRRVRFTQNADIAERHRHVRFVPKADINHFSERRGVSGYAFHLKTSRPRGSGRTDRRRAW